MKLNFVCAIAFLAAQFSWAQDPGARAKLIGAWQSQDQSAVWTLQEQGSGMHVTNKQGDRNVVEFACDFGKECEVTDAGKKVKVTLYFNGPKLIVLETRGTEIVKRRFSVVETGDTLEVENIQVVPEGKTDTIRFKRLPMAGGPTKP